MNLRKANNPGEILSHPSFFNFGLSTVGQLDNILRTEDSSFVSTFLVLTLMWCSFTVLSFPNCIIEYLLVFLMSFSFFFPNWYHDFSCFLVFYSSYSPLELLYILHLSIIVSSMTCFSIPNIFGFVIMSC